MVDKQMPNENAELYNTIMEMYMYSISKAYDSNATAAAGRNRMVGVNVSHTHN